MYEMNVYGMINYGMNMYEMIFDLVQVYCLGFFYSIKLNLMAQINDLVRTQNYKRLVAQLETKQSQISELQRELLAVKAKAGSTTEKAVAFDVVAEKLKIVNEYDLVSYVIPIGKNITSNVCFLDNKSNSKMMKFESFNVSPTETENVYHITGKLAAAENVYDAQGNKLATFQELDFGNATITLPADPGATAEFGDTTQSDDPLLIRIPKLYDVTIAEDVATAVKEESAYHEFAVLATTNNVWFKHGETYSLGEFEPTLNTFLGSVSIIPIGTFEEAPTDESKTTDNWQYYVKLDFPHEEDKPEIYTSPIPAEKPEQ